MRRVLDPQQQAGIGRAGERAREARAISHDWL
jgi:hypothetical protein